MTTVGYFNAMRELGSMRRAVDDAVNTRLRAVRSAGAWPGASCRSMASKN
jgi:hypothetical protein